MDNKHLAMWNWLYQNKNISDLFFNFSTDKNGATVIATGSGDTVVKQYMGNSSLRNYDFSIIQFKPVNSEIPNNSENATIMFDVEAVMDWIKKQNEDRNFPEFPSNCMIQKIEVLNNMPSVAGQDQAGAKYMFQCRVVYTQIGD